MNGCYSKKKSLKLRNSQWSLWGTKKTALNFFPYDIDYCSAHFQLPLSDLRTSFVTCLKRVRTEQF